MYLLQVDKEVMILTSYETAMRTAHNFLAVFLAKWVQYDTRCHFVYIAEIYNVRNELSDFFLITTFWNFIRVILEAVTCSRAKDSW